MLSLRFAYRALPRSVLRSSSTKSRYSDHIWRCTINLVKDDIYDKFVEDVTAKFTAKYGHAPEIYPVVISEGSHKVC